MQTAVLIGRVFTPFTLLEEHLPVAFPDWCHGKVNV